MPQFIRARLEKSGLGEIRININQIASYYDRSVNGAAVIETTGTPDKDGLVLSSSINRVKHSAHAIDLAIGYLNNSPRTTFASVADFEDDAK